MKNYYTVPAGLGGFQCTTRECEDNCCRNSTWNITVDEGAYKKYETMDNEFGRRILSCIEKTETGYKMREYDNGQCPLLDKDGFCEIHLNLGEGYLCTTCATYPRSSTVYAGKPEYWMSLSCPEVVRAVIYRDYKPFFVELEFVGEINSKLGEFEESEYKIRSLLYDIMNSKLTLLQKIMFMGVAMRQVGKIPKDENLKKALLGVIPGVRQGITNKDIINQLANVETPDRVLINSIIGKVAEISAQAASVPKVVPPDLPNAPYYDLMRNYREDVNSGEHQKYILDAYEKLVVPYVNENPNLFENYLRYRLHSTQYPKGLKDYTVSYTSFVGEFLAMLIFTAGLFHKKDKITEEEMVPAIYLFHRVISHNEKLRVRLAEIIGENASLGTLLGLFVGVR